MTTKVIQADREAALKPCPFCGDGKALVNYVRDGRRVVCLGCGASAGSHFNGPLAMPSAEDRAITAWNTRASHADPLRRALEQAFDFLGGVDDAAEIRSVILAALSSGENNNGE